MTPSLFCFLDIWFGWSSYLLCLFSFSYYTIVSTSTILRNKRAICMLIRSRLCEFHFGLRYRVSCAVLCLWSVSCVVCPVLLKASIVVGVHTHRISSSSFVIICYSARYVLTRRIGKQNNVAFYFACLCLSLCAIWNIYIPTAWMWKYMYFKIYQ